MNYFIYILNDDNMELMTSCGSLLEALNILEMFDDPNMVIINEDGIQEL